ncbi:pentapeptide repeat-containing protein [Paenibacillus durus]|uniref:pentapeptide repeat-containing protein n=1 Tax=Paenibacillus durus TaxID=44251 RepID=UPI0006937447|nr:pentapeptide repeat-containing protein [Paenibacillus durus]
MYDEEALNHFREAVLKPWHTQALLSLDREYHRRREELAAGFLAHFQDFCRSILESQLAGDKGALGYITYSMLRTGLLDGQAVYLAEGLDAGWFFDRRPVQASYDPQWAFAPLQRAVEEWEPAARKYAGKLPRPLLEKLRLSEAEHFHSYVAELIRYAMPQAAELPEFQALSKEAVFEVRAGEYLDHSITVYKEDKRGLSSQQIREWLGERSEEEYAYAAIEGANLSSGTYSGLDFRYTAFRECDLSFARMSLCVLIGTHWRNCLLDGADFSHSLLHGADFSGCRLQRSVFLSVRGGRPLEEAAEWVMPGFAGMRFAGADLTGAKLSFADLRGAVFAGANLSGADLTGADLRGADFTGADLSGAVLEGAVLDGAVLEAADLTGVRLPGGSWKTERREVER